MARVDDYKQALELGKKTIRDKNPDQVARLAGARLLRDGEDDMRIVFGFLNRDVHFSWPGLEMTYADRGEMLPLQQQILLIHYLNGAWTSDGHELTGEWIAFQDIPDGKFYLDAFIKRAKIPLVNAFGDRPERLVEKAEKAYGAVPLNYGDISANVQALPKIRVALILWRGDDEFPPEGNILFDSNTTDYFSAEDVAWLAGMIVYPLL
jgi:hypothetical protein